MFDLKNNKKTKQKIELVSIHIPKAAGTSFRNILQNTYGKKKVLRVDITGGEISINDKLSNINKIPPKTKVIHGHFNYSAIADHLNISDDVPVVTWVRDPVQRVISNYYYLVQETIKKLRNKNDVGALSQIQRTLLEYSRDKRNCNKMTHFLKGVCLEDLAFVGIQEHFDEELLFFASKFGHEDVTPLKHNVTARPDKKNDDLFENILDEIRELNSEDVALYENSLALRKERIKG